MFLFRKTGELRICIDYKKLKYNTIIDKYPIPRIDDTLERLYYAKILRKVNLASGYRQFEMHPDHHHGTAFQTRFGLFEYVLLPLDLRNAPITFQRLMNSIFQEALYYSYTAHLESISIYSSSTWEHIQTLNGYCPNSDLILFLQSLLNMNLDSQN